jgi:predicted nucleic acid-binding protein
MNGVFLDTVGMLAAWDKTDQWHPADSAAYDAVRRRACPLITTTAVLLECGNAAARRPFRQRVNAFRQALMAEELLQKPTPEDLIAAWGAFDRGEAGDAGIVDQISFAVMRRLGLTEAFTNDRHFQAAGFTVLF